MKKHYNPGRRRCLRISACAVACATISGVLASTRTGTQLISDIASSSSTNHNNDVHSSASKPSNYPGTHHFTTNALGANVSVSIVHRDKVAAQKIATMAFEEIKRLEQIFSLYIQDSSVVKLNTQGKLAYPPAELLSVFSHITGVWHATGGAFDPTVQPHWKQRGMAYGTQLLYSWNNVQYDAASIVFNNPDMAITLNGIAQGYISDKIARLLRNQGLENVLVNAGEIVAVGMRSDGMPWQIGLAERQSDSAESTVELTNMAIATSAPLSQNSDVSFASGHIINPTTGRSCDSPWQRLSVVHPSATIADALSTGLVMKSEDGIKRAIAQYPQAVVLAADVHGDQQTFTVNS